MPKKISILAIMGVLACGVLAAGCGSDDDSKHHGGNGRGHGCVDDHVGRRDAVTATDSTTSDWTVATADDIPTTRAYDAVAGTPAESAGEEVLSAGRRRIRAVRQQAEAAATMRDALAICQKAADEAVKQLQAAG